MTSTVIFEELSKNKNKVQAMTIKPDQKDLMVLVKENAYGWEKVVFLHPEGSEEEIPIQIIPIRYAEDPNPKDKKELEKLSHDRGGAVYELFTRWTNAGFNTHKAKDPFGSKEFKKMSHNSRFIMCRDTGDTAAAVTSLSNISSLLRCFYDIISV